MSAKTQRLGDWDDLRYFLAVARLGGLSAAAREMGVNQSTVYRRIGQLEEHLDARLFDRQARGYRLTAVGEQMVPLATRVEEDVHALGRAVVGADHELRGVVRITTVPEVLARIAPMLKCFRDANPGIDLEITTEQRVLSLTQREADVALRPGRPPTEPDVVGRRLCRLGLAAYAAPSYLEGRKRPRRISDLAKHDLIGLFGGGAGPKLVRDQLSDARWVCRLDTMTAMTTAARAGMGVAVLPTFTGDHDEGLERLFKVSYPDEAAEVGLWLLIHADLRQTARVRALVDHLKASITDKKPI